MLEDELYQLKRVKAKILISKANHLAELKNRAMEKYPNGDCDMYCPDCAAGLKEGTSFTVSILSNQHMCGMNFTCPNASECPGGGSFHCLPESSDLEEGYWSAPIYWAEDDD